LESPLPFEKFVVSRAIFAFARGMPPSKTSPNARSGRAAAPAQPSRRTRQEHSQETAQDYVELIAELIASTGEARIVDLARRLGITHVTVARTIQRLQREGLVTSLPYRSIFLTDVGRKLSEETARRHKIVVDFLRSLGVPEAVAQFDAEGIEHHVSKETLAAFIKHLKASQSDTAPQGAVGSPR
jgi:DtxR family manganese transport transcriptional regulator